MKYTDIEAFDRYKSHSWNYEKHINQIKLIREGTTVTISSIWTLPITVHFKNQYSDFKLEFETHRNFLDYMEHLENIPWHISSTPVDNDRLKLLRKDHSGGSIYMLDNSIRIEDFTFCSDSRTRIAYRIEFDGEVLDVMGPESFDVAMRLILNRNTNM